MSSRFVILHYHLFKNAGTSVDRLLEANFGERWVSREFEPRSPAQHLREVEHWLQVHPQAVAFSSHTIELPPPEVPGVRLLPIVLLRHPIDRIASVYAFERRQGGQGFGAVLARNTSLAGYIEVRLSLVHDRQCRDFHVGRLGRMFRASEGHEVERAMRALHSLPFIGLVEQFDASMERLAALVQPHQPEFHASGIVANSSRDHARPLAERLLQIRDEIGAERYAALLAANARDLALYEAAHELTCSPAPAAIA
jgi:hypothetical protein